MDNTLEQIANYIEKTTPYFPDRDDISDGVITVWDRVSPAVRSGDRYLAMASAIRRLDRNLEQSPWAERVVITLDRSNEWFGFSVTLK